MDWSEDAKRAANRVLELQKPGETKIVAFHSIAHRMIPLSIESGVPFGKTYHIPMADYNRIENDYREAGNKLLNETKSFFKNSNVEIETRLIESQEPEDYIRQITNEENFDLVVLGCKGHHSKFEEVFIGSVSEHVINNAACDVLLVR